MDEWDRPTSIHVSHSLLHLKLPIISPNIFIAILTSLSPHRLQEELEAAKRKHLEEMEQNLERERSVAQQQLEREMARKRQEAEAELRRQQQEYERKLAQLEKALVSQIYDCIKSI